MFDDNQMKEIQQILNPVHFVGRYDHKQNNNVVNLNQQVEDFNYLTKMAPFDKPEVEMKERKVYTSNGGKRHKTYLKEGSRPRFN
jgi:hypothetical protein